jgi:tripartite-type tricarboxylate transporter receptor subunit TctC
MNAPEKFRRRILLGAGAAAGLAAVPDVGWSQTWPARPMRIVIGFPPGATSDILARTIAEKLSAVFGQPVLVESKPGASTTIASQFVAKSPPDGYTWFINLALHYQNQLLYKSMPYDIFRDFANVTDICRSPVMLIVNSSNPAKTVKEFVDWGKGRKLSYASWGNGSTGHLLGHVFASQTGLDATHVAYKGGAAAVTDVVGGQVDSIIIDLGSTRAQISSGRLRALGLFLDKRMPQLPEVPTMEEAGIKGMNIAGFYGMYAPAGTPREIVARMSAEVQKILKMPDIVQRFYDFAFIPGGGDPERFTQMVRGEYLRWEPIVKSVGVQLEL